MMSSCPGESDFHRYHAGEMDADEAVRRAREALPAKHRFMAVFLADHARTLAAMERFAEAEAEFLASHDALQRSFGEHHHRTIGVCQALVELYETWGKPEKAAEWRAKAEDRPPAPTTQPSP
jgi:hypothetical protein